MIWIRFEFGWISTRIWVGFWSIRALVALVSSLGGPQEAPRSNRRSSLGKATRVTKGYKSYKVHNRVQDRSSSSLGANLGLDPVQNLSKSGLKPDYDDPGLKIESKIQIKIKIKIYGRILVEILGNPGRILGNPNRILGDPRKSQ